MIEIQILERGTMKKRDITQWTSKANEQRVDPQNFHTEYVRAHILKKVEGLDIVLKETKDDVSYLSQLVTSHSKLIKHLQSQICQISTYLNPRPKWGLPIDNMVNQKNES